MDRNIKILNEAATYNVWVKQLGITEKEIILGLMDKASIPLDKPVKPACGYCKDCKFWKQESLECKNDIIWLNKDKNIFFNISDLKTNTFFGCVRFESKSV